MRSGDHRDPKLLAAGLQQPPGSTIGIDDGNRVVLSFVFLNGGGDRIGDLIRGIVKLRR